MQACLQERRREKDRNSDSDDLKDYFRQNLRGNRHKRQKARRSCPSTYSQDIGTGRLASSERSRSQADLGKLAIGTKTAQKRNVGDAERARYQVRTTIQGISKDSSNLRLRPR